MTQWKHIHSGIQLSAKDKFSFAIIDHVPYPAEAREVFALQFLSEEQKKNPITVARAIQDPTAALRMFLSGIMSSTFAIGWGQRGVRLDKPERKYAAATQWFEDDGAKKEYYIYVGTRNHADLFKLMLKVPGFRKTASWKKTTKFNIRVAKDDDYTPITQGSIYNGVQNKD